MAEMRIKTRDRAATESVAEADAVSAKPANTVIKLGAKERLNSYVTPEQKRKLRLLAIERNCSISEIVGILTDEAKAPTV